MFQIVNFDFVVDFVGFVDFDVVVVDDDDDDDDDDATMTFQMH